MKKAILLFLVVCVCCSLRAQTTNFVLNPSFEQYSKCPDVPGRLVFANHWKTVVDSDYYGAGGYYNSCAGTNIYSGTPNNINFYQYPHSGDGMAGGSFYYDKTPPPPSPYPSDYRCYIQGHLVQHLEAGKTYCVAFWVNNAEAGGYAINKMGAYLDNGNINLTASAGSEITFVTPQVYTDSIIIDTANWTKIEGTFVATGNETYITIGNFFTNAATSTVVTNYWGATPQFADYLVDDVSVIPIDLKADAGTDRWVEQTKTVPIGRVGDTTAGGLDCHWYHKGVLIDSGATISVNAAATKGVVDTYVVVQTICGNVTTDTVLVTTVGLGVTNSALQNSFTIYPNPSDGNIFVRASNADNSVIRAKVFDLLGRVIQLQEITFSGDESAFKINALQGNYIIELQDEGGSSWRERINIR